MYFELSNLCICDLCNWIVSHNLFLYKINNFYFSAICGVYKASRDTGAQVNSYKHLVMGSSPTRGIEIFHFSLHRFVTRQNSIFQHATSPEFDGKWAAKCFMIRLSLPTLLHTGYSVKIYMEYKCWKISKR